MSAKSSASLESARSRSPSQQRAAERRHRHDSIVCKPLDSLSDVREFLNDPPAWRSLCTELRPHSEYAIKNIDIVRQNHGGSDFEIQLENPETFCHFTVDKEDVRRHRRKTLPKTLVCHDMANGYHDDSNIDGTGNYEAYSFYNWAVVDIFCYFSHHFVTIPPLGWINVAHAHGVKVIGTVITEWGAGAGVWDALLAASERWKEFARSLVAIAKTLKFDGWLLNVENQISKPAVLIEFVRHLHALMHSEMADPVLLWYDSVTERGQLAWQNGLNENNYAFFAACDGIFTNYSWKEADVRSSRAAAGARAHDVFVGLDVWGRNFLGGGQFNTQEAAKIAHAHGCSLAIFAPAWTHEAMAEPVQLPVQPAPPEQPAQSEQPAPAEQPAQSEQPAPAEQPAQLDRWGSWRRRERALWGSLWPLLHTKLPRALPFSTSFCTGQGARRRLYGEVLGPVPWYNLRHQQYQPNSSLGPHGYRLAPHPAHEPTDEDAAETKDKTERAKSVEENTSEVNMVLPPNATLVETENKHPKICKTEYRLEYVEDDACVELWLRDSFTGGGCLLLRPPGASSRRLLRLFHCDFLVEHELIACVVSKTLPPHEQQELELVLFVRHEDGARRRLVLAGSSARETEGAGPGARETERAGVVLPLRGEQFRRARRHLLLRQPGFYVSVENSYGWKVRYYSVRLRGRVTSLSVRGASRAPLLLGHLALCHKLENED